MWTNSNHQLGHGLTKPAARVKLAQILSRGYHSLKLDPNVVAARKRTEKQKTEYQDELGMAKKQDETE